MYNNQPKVSIIMPVYNTEKYLDQAIQSILNQTFKDFELIIIDDGSTDSSIEIIKKYLNDKRVVLIKNKENMGISKSINVGIEKSKAALIARLDSDDNSRKDRLEKQYNYMKKNSDLSIIGSYVDVIDEDGKLLYKLEKPVTYDEIMKVCFFYGPFVQSSIMFKKVDVEKIGKYRGQYDYCEDIDLYLRLLYAGYKGENIPEYLVEWRQYAESTNKYHRKKATINKNIKKEIIDKYGEKISFFEKLSMYIHYYLDITLGFEKKRKVEKFVKNIYLLFKKQK